MPRHRPHRLLLALLLGCAATAAAAFDLQGHRGARGLAPENTRAAFDQALALGVSTLELDIHLSADGVPVIAHDPYLPPDMARNAQGEWLTPPTPLIHQLRLAELQRYDLGRARPNSATARNFAGQQARDGERLPTLAQLFERVQALGATQVRFNIETKLNPERPADSATPEAVVQAILYVARRHGMQERVTLQSFDWRTLKIAREIAPAMPTAYLTRQTAGSDNTASPLWTAGARLADYRSVPHMVHAGGGAVWSPNFAALTPTALAEAHQLGLKVIPWTVNAPADMRRLIDWGVDGLITDYPDRAREAMRAAGLRLPEPVRLP